MVTDPAAAIPTYGPKDHFTTKMMHLEIIHDNRSKPKPKAVSNRDTNFVTELSLTELTSREQVSSIMPHIRSRYLRQS